MSLDLKIVPFSNKESKIEWTLNEFKENGRKLAILFETKNKTAPETTNYRFGFIDPSGLYFWFFNGLSTANDRTLALNAFSQLSEVCSVNNLGVPFVYKEYEKRE